MPPDSPQDNATRIIKIDFDYGGPRPLLPPEAEQERSIAVYDLIEENYFVLPGTTGPYHLVIRSDARHIYFDIRDTADKTLGEIFLAMGPMRGVIRDYRSVCENYFDAIRTKTPQQIQAIDMGRRSLHDEGADILKDRLEGKVVVDNITARRLFTLICVIKTGNQVIT